MEQQNTPRQPESNKKKRFNRCWYDVSDLSLEDFRLPNDGRKWQQAARNRYEFLRTLAGYANPDGSFVRKGKNFSPSAELLERKRHIPERTQNRHSEALRQLGWLSWTRPPNHYGRRTYTIHLPGKNHRPDSNGKSRIWPVKHRPPWPVITQATVAGDNTCHIRGQSQQNDAVTPTVQYYPPSLESLPSSRLPSEFVSAAVKFSPNTEPSQAAAKAFSAFGFRSPFGHQQFRNAVVRSAKKISKGNILEVMEAVIVELHQKVPPQWYDAKHKLEVAKPAFDHRKLKQL